MALSFHNVCSYVYTFVRSFVRFILYMYIYRRCRIQLDLVNSFLFMLLLLFNGRQNHYKHCNTYLRMYLYVINPTFFALLSFFITTIQVAINTDGDSLHQYTTVQRKFSRANKIYKRIRNIKYSNNKLTKKTIFFGTDALNVHNFRGDISKFINLLIFKNSLS